MKKNNFFERFNHKVFFITGFIFILFINLIAFPLFPKLFSKNFVSTTNILDLQFGYNIDKVFEILNNLHRQGREIYFYSTLFVDTPYALFYGFFYAVIFYSLLKNTGKLKRLKFLIFFPFLISISDLLENLFTLVFIRKYPNISPNLIHFGSLFNQMKWIFSLISLLIFLYLIFNLFITKYLQKNQ